MSGTLSTLQPAIPTGPGWNQATPAAGTTLSATVPGAAADAAKRLGGDMQTFMKMLTTQLQNQDPMQPLDPSEFTAQLSQFAAVEQQIAVNQHLDSLIALQRSSMMLAAAPLVGRRVEVESATLALRGGSAPTVRLPAAEGAMRHARLSLTDGAGRVVREAMAPLGNVASDWVWDGRDAGGRPLPDGDYRLALLGVDAAGTTRSVLAPTVSGTVTGVAQGSRSPTLSLGNLSVGLDALRSLRD